MTRSPADCVRHPPTTHGWRPGDSSRRASAAPWRTRGGRRRRPDPAAIAPLAPGRPLHTMIRTTESKILDITEVGGETRRHRPAERASQENFPVASRALPRAVRSHLLAIYGVARVVDDTGDELAGDRLAALDALEDELQRAYRGTATHPAFVRLTPTIRALDLDDEPFRALIEANRLDQLVTATRRGRRCATTARSRRTRSGGWCSAVFGARRPSGSRWSDDVCTALQLIEHLQDVGEDSPRGRVYLPAEDLARVRLRDARPRGRRRRRPAAAASSPSRSTAPAAAAPGGAAAGRRRPAAGRLAVAGFAAGGLATLDAIERGGYDVLAVDVRPVARAHGLRTVQVGPPDGSRHDASTTPTRAARRSPAARPRTSRTGSGCSRRRSARRCRRSTRSPGGSTTSATATRARREAGAARRGACATSTPCAGAATPRRRRPRARRARRRRGPLPDPARTPSTSSSTAARWTRRARPTSLRPPRRLLPPGRRLDRAAVARRLRHATGAARGRRARRRPRCRAAADQHPARRRRGPRDGPRLPARRGPRALRLRAATSTGPRATRSAQLVALRGRRARELVRRAGCGCSPLLDRRSRACVGAMAGIYRRLLVRIDGRPDGRARAPACRSRRGRRPGSRPAASPGTVDSA